MKRTAAIILALGLTASPVLAQGAITDGDVTFEYTDFIVGGGNLADLEVDTGTDHMFQQWWYYRLAGDAEESVLPPPDDQVYAGSVATLTWDNVDGRGFSATEVSRVVDSGDGAGGVQHGLAITNNNAEPLLITVFKYTDMDLDVSIDGDSAIDVTPTHIGVMDTSISSFRALGADAFKVTEFSDLRDELEDSALTNLDNSGTPFGPGDFTGAFQWRGLTIPPGVTATYRATHFINDARAPLEIAFSGTCPGDVDVRIAGATPGSDVAIAGAGALGFFRIPGGGCAGTVLNLDSPSLLARVTVDDSGERTLMLSLPPGACGRVAQAVDTSSCNVTNTDLIR